MAVPGGMPRGFSDGPPPPLPPPSSPAPQQYGGMQQQQQGGPPTAAVLAAQQWNQQFQAQQAQQQGHPMQMQQQQMQQQQMQQQQMQPQHQQQHMHQQNQMVALAEAQFQQQAGVPAGYGGANGMQQGGFSQQDPAAPLGRTPQGLPRKASGCWYAARNKCFKSEECPYSHTPEALRQALIDDPSDPTGASVFPTAPPTGPKAPCWYWERGVCTNGNSCPFQHIGNILQNAGNLKRMRVEADDEPVDDNIYTAVKVAFSVANAAEREDVLKKLRWKIAKYARETIKEVPGPIQVGCDLERVVRDYADYLFQKIWQSLGDRDWLNEVDLLLILDNAVKELIPPEVLSQVPIHDLERIIFQAHDYALDEQKCLPIVWELVQQAVQGPKIRKKVREACENGRRKAATDSGVLGPDDFAREWILNSVNELRRMTDGYPDSVLMKADAIILFTSFLSGGAIPERHVAMAGSNLPVDWKPLVENIISEGYKPPAPTGGHMPPAAAMQGMQMSQMINQWGMMGNMMG